MKAALRYLATLGTMLGLGVMLSGSNASPPVVATPEKPIPIYLTPMMIRDGAGVVPKGQRFGPLRFSAAYRLTTRHPDFGGVSSLAARGKTVYALSDVGRVLTLAPKWKGTKLASLDLQEVETLTDVTGAPLTTLYKDSEGMTLRPDGSLLVSFERMHRIDHYASAGSGKLESLPLSHKITDKLPFNGGFESIATLDPTHLVAFSEHAYTKQGYLRGWLFSPNGATPLRYQPAPGYGISEATVLPNGDLLVVERAYRIFTWPWRFAVRLTVVPRGQIGPDATLTPTTIATFDERSGVDNIESATVVKLPNGRRMLMLMSDDNFNPQQQSTTMLLFDIRGGGKSRAI